MPPQTRLWEFCNKIIVFLLKLYIKVHRHKEAVHLDFFVYAGMADAWIFGVVTLHFVYNTISFDTGVSFVVAI